MRDNGVDENAILMPFGDNAFELVGVAILIKYAVLGVFVLIRVLAASSCGYMSVNRSPTCESFTHPPK